jgi:hypothetical protein
VRALVLKHIFINMQLFESKFKQFLSESMHSDIVRTVREATPGLLFHLLDQFSLMHNLDVATAESPVGYESGTMVDFLRDVRNVTPKDEYEMDSLQAENLVGRLSETELQYILLDLIENIGKIKGGKIRSLLNEIPTFEIEGENIIDFLKNM